MRIPEQVRRLRDVWRRTKTSKYASSIRKLIRWFVFAGIIAYLGYQFTAIGWYNVWTSLPQTPWFYVLSLVMYAMLPLVEAFLYGRLWGTPFGPSLPVFLRKRVYNHDVVGYSGEIYFAWWGQKNVPLSKKKLFATIKDNTIISGITSTAVAALILGVFFLSGRMSILEPYLPDTTMTWVGIGALVLVTSGIGVALRRFIFSLKPKTLGFIGGVHAVRFLLLNVLQVVQWMVVLPDVPIEAWISLISLFIVINQLPFLPSRDLVFLGAGVELSTWLGISPAAIAGMLLVKSAIDKSLNILVFLSTGIRGSTDLPPEAEEEWKSAREILPSKDRQMEAAEV